MDIELSKINETMAGTIKVQFEYYPNRDAQDKEKANLHVNKEPTSLLDTVGAPKIGAQ